jgi:cobalamin biosynthesis Mg chelatase CobN
LAIGALSNSPSPIAATWQLGATGPISSVWTGAPLGVPWNLMTGAIQNAANQFVPPSTAAAVASAGDASFATTSDSTTNNLVTFNAVATDATAYNNFLMEESYLVVPTNGLSAAKAKALAQLIRFTVGPLGQQDIKGFGAAPATPAMVAADLKVAAVLDTESVVSAAQAATTGSTGATTTTAAPASGAASPGSGSGTPSDAGSGTGGSPDSSSGLAFTGAPNLIVLVGTGTLLVVAGALYRRRLRHREVRS